MFNSSIWLGESPRGIQDQFKIFGGISKRFQIAIREETFWDTSCRMNGGNLESLPEKS